MRQKIENHLANLTRREKIALLCAGALIGVFVLYVGILSPVLSFQSRLAASVISKDDQLRKVYDISGRIKALRESSMNGGAVRPPNFTLFGFLEELAGKVGVSDRIEYMKPVSDLGDTSREAVELKIRSVYQEDLISLLYDIEHSPYSLVIKRLNIRRVEKDNNLDVTFQVVNHG